MNTLKKDWKSDLGIGHVLQVGTLHYAAAAAETMTSLERSCALGWRRWCAVC